MTLWMSEEGSARAVKPPAKAGWHGIRHAGKRGHLRLALVQKTGLMQHSDL